MYSGQTKPINRLRPDGRNYALRAPGKEITLKHGSDFIVVWGRFFWHGVGPVHYIKGITAQHMYINILRLLHYHMQKRTEKRGLVWKFEPDN
ncbi:hypothetical protein Trydic_g17687 [Trypoxylus dichotomus]